MHLKDLIFLKWYGVTVLEILRVKISKNYRVSKKNPNRVYSRVDILLMVAQNPIIHSIF